MAGVTLVAPLALPTLSDLTKVLDQVGVCFTSTPRAAQNAPVRSQQTPSCGRENNQKLECGQYHPPPFPPARGIFQTPGHLRTNALRTKPSFFILPAIESTPSPPTRLAPRPRATMSPHHSARLPPRRLNREHPSFSAALLDAIYHSLDADARTAADPRRAPMSPAERPPPPSRHRPSPTLSPSVSSVRSPRLQKPPRPCRVRPDPQPSHLLPPPPPPPESTRDSAENRRNRKKKTKSEPFACLLNALLCNRKPAESIEPMTALALPPVTVEPASARSILSSRASRRESAGTGGFLTPGRRAVRFSPVAVVVDEEHGREAGAARLRVAEMEVETADAERRVEELLRELGVAEETERERAKESSESSSDLFELESLTAFDDTELPRPRAAAGVGLARSQPRIS